MNDHRVLYVNFKDKVMSTMNKGLQWIMLGWFLVATLMAVLVYLFGDIHWTLMLVVVPASIGLMYMTYITQQNAKVYARSLTRSYKSTYTLGPADISSVSAITRYLEGDVRKSELAKSLYILCSVNIVYVTVKSLVGG